MKTKLLLSIVICFLMIYPLLSQEKMSIAVLEMDAVGLSKQEAQVLTNRLRTELFKTDKFSVLERDKMDEILDEQGFQLSGCTTNECAVEAGKLVGVLQMVAGNVAKLGELYTIDIRLIDVESGKVLRTATDDCYCKIEVVLTESMRKVAHILSNLRIEGQETQRYNNVKEKDERADNNIKTKFLPIKNKFGIGIKFSLFPIAFGGSLIYYSPSNLSLSTRLFYSMTTSNQLTLGDWNGGQLYLYSDRMTFYGIDFNYQYNWYLNIVLGLGMRFESLENIRFHIGDNNEEEYSSKMNKFRSDLQLGINKLISNHILLEAKISYFFVGDGDWIKRSFSDYSEINNPDYSPGSAGLRSYTPIEFSLSLLLLF